MHAITRNTYMHKIRNNMKTKGSSVRLSFLSSTKNLNNHLTSKFPEINKTDKKKSKNTLTHRRVHRQHSSAETSWWSCRCKDPQG